MNAWNPKDAAAWGQRAECTVHARPFGSHRRRRAAPKAKACVYVEFGGNVNGSHLHRFVQDRAIEAYAVGSHLVPSSGESVGGLNRNALDASHQVEVWA
jgi:hypothetical protein